MSEEYSAKVRAVRDFRQRTEREVRGLEQQLLDAKDMVYELEFDFAKLNFKRMELDDCLKLESEFPNEDQLRAEPEREQDAWNLVCEILAKYNADGISKTTWLQMVKQTPADVQEVILNLYGLSKFGKAGMAQFFRLITNRQEPRDALRTPTSSPQRSDEATSLRD